MALSGIEFVLVLSCIWIDANLFGPDNLWEAVLFAALTLPLTGGLGMIGLYLLHKPDNRFAALKLLGVAGVCELLFLVASVDEAYRLRNFIGTAEHWWETAWSMMGYGLLAVLILAGGLQGLRKLKIVGLLSVAAGLVMLLYEIWIGGKDQPEPFAFVTIVAIAFGHGNVIWLMQIKPGAQSITRMAVQVLAIITAVLAQLAVTRAITAGHQDDWARLAGACSFMLVCGTFALLVINAANRRSNRKRTVEESELTYKQISLTCPHCQTTQTLPVGESQCTSCSMQFQIKLFEPHCPQCDYLLVNCTSDTCPECGHVIKAAPEKTA
jgi:peptidoglycan/LPS O-acetylase OafA/YrhL